MPHRHGNDKRKGLQDKTPCRNCPQTLTGETAGIVYICTTTKSLDNRNVYHSAAVDHVVQVFMRVRTEVDAGRDAGERAPGRLPQSTARATLFKVTLKI